MAFPNPHVSEATRDGVNGAPDIVETESAAKGGVDEGSLPIMRAGSDVGGDIEKLFLREWNGNTFTVKSGVRFTKPTSRIHDEVATVRSGSYRYTSSSFLLLFYFRFLLLLLLLLLFILLLFLLYFLIYSAYCFIRFCFYLETIYFFSVHFFFLNKL